ncbi:uncharacterized protein K452DRAFT_315179 [Aplosporella prunicola CBS 121167]|uniref:Protein transport protein sec16 n=1 Tax=Aplosporella prunicola CBS 121167 TaxID=1176127 RepID=A0A6A6BQ60_9PEZI|nr:uncharacterized protein K452DRAFT_315179 [Aplosporella prunicola CBS 121167]KAF2145878.1 hypothetical protein K452DRAFT_315179 [Aplosporella prunicola CBS 121167]
MENPHDPPRTPTNAADDTIPLSTPQPEGAAPTHHPQPQDLVAESVETAQANVSHATSPPMSYQSPETLETAPRTSWDAHPVNGHSRTNTLELAAALDNSDDDFFSRRYDSEAQPAHDYARETTTAPEEAPAVEAPAHPSEPSQATEGAAAAPSVDDQVLKSAQKPDLPPNAEPLPVSAQDPVPVDEQFPAPAHDSTQDPVEEQVSHPTEDSESARIDDAVSVPIEQPEPGRAEGPAPTPLDEAAPTPAHEQPDIETIDTEALHATNPAAEASDEHANYEHYEHQGETTALEQAAQEKADAPLAEDTGSPNVEWGATDTFDLGTHTMPVEEAKAETFPEVQPEDSVVHQEAENEAATAVEQSAPDLDWGAADAEDFVLGTQEAGVEQVQPEPMSHQEPEMAPADIAPESGAVERDWNQVELECGTAPDGPFNVSLEPTSETAYAEDHAPTHQEPTDHGIATTEEHGTGNLDWGKVDEDIDFDAITQPTQETSAEAPSTAEVPTEAPQAGVPQTEVSQTETSSFAPKEPEVQNTAMFESSDGPDLDWGNAGDADIDFGAIAQPEQATSAEVPSTAEAPQTEAPSFAHEVPAVQNAATAEPSGAPDLDWGTADDADFGFGANTSEAQGLGLSGAEEKPTENKEPDLSAMWAEALADDDLLDDTPAESGSVDPSAFFLDEDDEGFLDDTVPQPDQNGTQTPDAAAPGTVSTSASKYAPAAPAQPAPAPTVTNPYAPQGLQKVNLSQPSMPAQVSPYGAYASASPYAASAPFQQQPTRPAPTSAQSFAAKSKGGYSSPYDLPEDIVKPKRRAPVHSQTMPIPQQRAPPPRISSMYSNPASPAMPPPSAASMSPAMASPSVQPPTGAFGGSAPPERPKPPTSKPSSGFFEELPVVPKPRPSGRYTPQVIAPTPPPQQAVPPPGPPPAQFQPPPPVRQSSQTYAPPPPVAAPVQRPASTVYAPPVPPPVQRPASTTYAAPVVPPVQRPASTTYAPPTVPQVQRSVSSYAPAAAQPVPPPMPRSTTAYAPPAAPQLQQPERLDPFPAAATTSATSTLAPVPPAVPATAARYSPAPPAAPAVASRYSPAPPSAPSTGSKYSPAPPSAPLNPQNRYSAEPTVPLPKPATMPFAPRTSSPLAFHSTPHHQEHVPPPRPSSSTSLQQSIASVEDSYRRASLEPVQETLLHTAQKPATPPPPPRSVPASVVGSPKRRSTANYTPQSAYAPQSSYTPQSNPPQYHRNFVSSPGQDSEMPPVRRSQSQSPGATMKGPKLAMAPIERPASVTGLASPVGGPQAQYTPSVPASAGRKRTFSVNLNYIKPTDELAMDPLERWKGSPIFKWGLGGSVLTTFPKHIPRYGTGAVGAMIKCTPGEVKLQSAKTLCPLSDSVAKFPGPLKTKGKKKDVLGWLKSNIESMDKDYREKIFNGELLAEARTRFEEKILLWKILEIFVEHDGHLEGSDAVNQAVKKVLAPEGSESSEGGPVLTSADLMGQTTSTGSAVTAEPIDPQAVDQLRAHLLKGDREKAVWDAVDKRLWGHAMLIASTLSKDLWKQVVQEFVRQDVRKVSGNNQSLAALYEVFAGNWEDSIDELVPASARAGFQMVSKTDRSGANTNVLEGLDRWRETLLLVTSNRSEGDNQALVALGKLLAGYGRVEAAHICFLFARTAVILGGAEDPAAHLVLIGADRFDVGKEMEPILLTEIFEYAVTLSSSMAPPAIPHLQAYKLARAFTLAEYGYRTEAQAYCDSIAAAMKSTTKVSPYYHSTLVSELDDLIKRLSQSPKDGSSSWISKPTMGKVSSSVWSSFNKFVAGEDDSDGASTGGAAADQRSPFAKMSGETPTVSRSPSVADLSGSFGAAMSGINSSAVAGSRYAPAAPSAYAPRSSMEKASRYAPQNSSPYAPSRSSMETMERPDMVTDPMFAHQETPPSSYNPSSQYAPKPASVYAPSGLSSTTSPPNSMNPLGSPYSPTTAMGSYQPLAATMHNEAAGDNAPQTNNFGPPLGSNGPQKSPYEPQTSPYDPPASSYEPPTSSYEPPTSSYEPPSYQPYEPEPEEEKEAETKPKKSMMDDDDDDELERRAATLKAQQKAEADRIADEAFRKAAEADAAKEKNPPKKGGGSWLGGWFKKSADTDSPKPIRAKLGEENSFYYDPDLKKWVNKKAGAEQTSTPSATPPPPKGGPPPGLRGVASTSNLAGAAAGGPPKGLVPPGALNAQMRSTSMPPPMAMAASAPGTRSATPAGAPPGAAGDSPALGGPPPPSGPPSRPATSMSNASSIDDLLGVPAPRKGAAKKGKRGGRYVDVMAK